MTVESRMDVLEDPSGGLPPAGSHLSFFALDGLRLGHPPGEREAQHLRACAFCAEQVAPPAPEPIPLWLYQARLAAAEAGGPSPWTSRIRWASFSLSSLAVAAAVVVLARPPVPPPSESESDRSSAARAAPQVRAKGQTPAARLYLRRGDEVSVWDGRSPIRAGDRLRLELQPAGYTHVSVAAAAPGGEPVVLHQGPLVEGAGLLPLSFRVDDQGQQEIVSVLLGHGPFPPGAHQAVPPDTWHQLLVLPKEIAP